MRQNDAWLRCARWKIGVCTALIAGAGVWSDFMINVHRSSVQNLKKHFSIPKAAIYWQLKCNYVWDIPSRCKKKELGIKNKILLSCAYHEWICNYNIMFNPLLHKLFVDRISSCFITVARKQKRERKGYRHRTDMQPHPWSGHVDCNPSPSKFLG